jgi:hypothetical protein
MAAAAPAEPLPQPTPMLGRIAVESSRDSQPTPWGPRTLADVARERKGKAKPSGAVSLTDSTVSAGDAAQPRTPRPASQASSEESWRHRMSSAREALAGAEEGKSNAQKRLQSGTNITQGQYLDGPVKDEMDRRRSNLDAASRQVETARQRLKELEEEARRADVPPGWLR